MFALAVWDSRERRLLLARDRLGKKPLFYARHRGGLVFASEIKAILQVPDLSPKISPASLNAYLRFTYVPAPFTIFEGVYKLPPGCLLEFDGGDPRIQAYWDLRFADGGAAAPDELWEEELLPRLREAVRIRLMGEVPLGAFLSGGVDSSAVVALMAEASPQPVKTFSIGFKDPAYDETPYARLVAARYGTDHHEHVVEPEGLDELLPRIVWHFDEPFADASALPTYYVSKFARSAVTVVLTGDGGDESFAGYPAFQSELLAGRLDRAPAIARAIAGPEPMRLLARLAPRRFAFGLERLERVLDAARQPPFERFSARQTRMSTQLRRRIYAAEFAEPALSTSIAAGSLEGVGSGVHPSNRLAYWLTRHVLPNDMLVKVDRMTMAHSLEARCPLLDHELVEFAARVPPRLKLRGWTTKYLLKRALAPLLPREVLSRRKQGFVVPLRQWFSGDLAAYARDLLLSSKSVGRGYFDGSALRQLIDDHVSGRQDHGTHLWQLVNLELWNQIFVDDAHTSGAPPTEAGRPPSTGGLTVALG
jgi:asparagine synthase (glutamine-hydrolysing)